MTDQLLAAERMLERWEQGYELHPDELIATIGGLYEALRAALAVVAGSAIPESEWITPAEDMWQDDDPSAAGSATATRCHECEGRGHTWEFSRDGYVTCDWCGGSGEEPGTAAMAGSATPTGDNDGD